MTIVAGSAATHPMDGIEDLTEKEKETLRLIVRGHDAKSMASELSLSVHTINERLRVARRKLGVTSSREAGRMLLESEVPTHENLGHIELRGARDPRSGDPAGEVAGNSSRHMIAGILGMMTLFAVGLILTSQVADTSLSDAQVEASATDVAVTAAAHRWLALVDDGDWQASFDAAGQSFRDVNTVKGWAGAAGQVRTPLGALVSRELLTIRYLNAPPQGFQEVVFATHYASRSEPVTETLTLQLEDGVWKVVGIIVD